MQSHKVIQAAIVARRLLATCVMLLFAEGCHQNPTTVSGTVTLDGRPMSIASDARGTVVFQPVGGQGTMLTSLLDPSGHFKLATGASSNVAPGKYQVAISVVELLPKSEKVEQGARLITPAKYASTSNSGLEADVVPGENRLSFKLDSKADEEDSGETDSTPPSSESGDSNPDADSADNN
jgi:hypothetical protein